MSHVHAEASVLVTMHTSSSLTDSSTCPDDSHAVFGECNAKPSAGGLITCIVDCAQEKSVMVCQS